MINKILKKVKKKTKSIFWKKKPIFIPVVEGHYLDNRTAFITGGTSGIGYSIAESFLKNGANVIILGRNETKLKKAIEKLKSIDDSKVYGFIFDVSNTEKIKESFNNILNQIDGKKIDILVNNAGISAKNGIGKTTIEDYDNVLNTNLRGTYFLSQVISNYMIENKIHGNILNIASSSSLRPVVNPYSLSKWGIRGLTVGLAKKLIKHGIVVNGIAPGPTATPMLVKDYNEDSDITLKSLPIERYILPEEIANMAVFLTSNLGKSIVGDIVYMTGGAGTITVDDISY